MSERVYSCSLFESEHCASVNKPNVAPPFHPSPQESMSMTSYTIPGQNCVFVITLHSTDVEKGSISNILEPELSFISTLFSLLYEPGVVL